jgi:hypothetical protein
MKGRRARTFDLLMRPISIVSRVSASPGIATKLRRRVSAPSRALRGLVHGARANERIATRALESAWNFFDFFCDAPHW